MNLCFIKCIRVSYPGGSERSAELATDLHLVPNLRIGAALTPFPVKFSLRLLGKILLYFIEM